MEVFIEKIIIYTIVAPLILLTIYLYISSFKKTTQKTEEKILKAKEEGPHEPVSLHP